MKVYSLKSYIDILSESGMLVKYYIHDALTAIDHITYNSKDVRENTLFTCKGRAFVSKYLDEAILNGACCYMSEKEYTVAEEEVSYIIVSDVRKAMAIVADVFYDKAYKKLNLIGITGTKGKSTTAYYVKYILDEYQQSKGAKPSGIMSSIDTYDGIELFESHLTTPEAYELHRHFDNAVKTGIEFFEMEVSSQALKYDRVLGVEFDIGVFLNISEDHISSVEHSDLEDYLSSKLKLFGQSKLAIVNLDSDYIDRVLDAAKDSPRVLTFGSRADADYYVYDVKKVDKEIHFTVDCSEFKAEKFVLTMPGLFNVENAMAAIAICSNYSIPIDIIKSALYKARSSGRMEIYATLDEEESVIAIVDYAHNKLSFEKLFESIKQEYPDRSIITVFGCPGGKAYNRRKELGELSGMYSDKVYLTAEDPADENISDISTEIEQYVKKYECDCYKLDDRGEAIKAAVFEADRNSIILITGKGNETRQKIRGEYVSCPSDTDYVKEYLAEVSKSLVK